MLPLALMLAALATPHAGQTATVDVAVATLWTAPGAARAIDRPALGNPVDLDAWNRNLRSTAARAGLDSRVGTQALYGEAVRVLAVRGGWAKVAVPDQPTPLDRRGYPGWLPLRQLAAVTVTGGRTLSVLARKALLHLSGGRTLILGYGTRLHAAGAASGGSRRLVRTPDGAGWIAGDALGKPPAPTGAAVVAAAKRFVGLRYLWGGVSAWGFDCSGLVWDVFHSFGVTVPRDTGPQSHAGAAVAPSSLRPGDLVFYGLPATHVAIVAGPGTMLESPDSAHSVRLVPLRPGFTAARRYVAAR